MMKPSEIFKILKPIAVDLSDDKYRHIAAVVYKGNIISYGMSVKKSHPFAAKYSNDTGFSIYWHAETNAIFNALKVLTSKELSKSDIYVCRVKNNEARALIFGLSKPCRGCMNCIKEHSLRNVYYSLDSFCEKNYGVIETRV